MKMKSVKFVSALVAVAALNAQGAGFGLYEASARGLGMGNGLVGSTGDASANYYNPANLTELTNASVMVGVTLINPFCDVKVNGRVQPKMDAGWFTPPHAYVAVPVLKDLVLGFGTYCEYGLGTKYDNNWLLKHDTTETTIEQFTFNPNIAYKITEDWSVAFGARLSYITFENYKSPMLGYNQQFGYIYGRSHLEGDDFNCGYMLATSYKVNDDLSLGLVYRSRINHHIEGEFEMNGVSAGVMGSGDANAKVVLPASITFGANYEFTEKFRGGASLTWTEWSTINHIDFNLPNINTPNGPSNPSEVQYLNWHDAWRLGFGFEYDLTDAFTGRIGYSFDWDPSAESHGTTMLPPGDRHIIGFGASYKFLDHWRIDLGYSFILMESETRMIEGIRFQCDNSYSHLASASLSYTF